MKRVIWVTLLLFISVTTAFADEFQIFYKEGGNEIKNSIVKVYVRVRGKEKPVANGKTNGSGRITFKLHNREYIGYVSYKNKWWRIKLNIDGSGKLKPVNLK